MNLQLHKISKAFAKNSFYRQNSFSRIFSWSCEVLGAFTDQNELVILHSTILKNTLGRRKIVRILVMTISTAGHRTYLVKILLHEMLQKSMMAPFSGLCNQQQDWSHLFNPMWRGVQGLAQDSGLHSWPTWAAAPPLPLLCTFYYSPACLPLRTAFSPTVALILKMWKLLHKCLKNIGNFILLALIFKRWKLLHKCLKKYRKFYSADFPLGTYGSDWDRPRRSVVQSAQCGQIQKIGWGSKSNWENFFIFPKC